eukprot:TRINITY_DN3995_c0_g1_i3.p1 TRINITY_DN3995_c0_g1~~TRINITY_DN3995_c0_g1_i3.p1  ORF type:complete len:114 (-),score=10.20 TRINITY_DN3995_c0_g1_i3:635-976(-)
MKMPAFFSHVRKGDGRAQHGLRCGFLPCWEVGGPIRYYLTGPRRYLMGPRYGGVLPCWETGGKIRAWIKMLRMRPVIKQTNTHTHTASHKWVKLKVLRRTERTKVRAFLLVGT